jgi:2-dehydro-3-deoxygluconokinase
VAVSLANYGKDAYFVSKLPTNEIGQAAVSELRKFGVNTEYIARGGERLGIYFYEKGFSQRPSKVIYDRSHSAIAEAKKEDFDWKRIFEGASWFHFTSNTPAISEECASITLEAVKAAKEAGVTVSVDLNYCKQLWKKEKARTVMSELVKFCDVVIANAEDAEILLDIKVPKKCITEGNLSEDGYREVARQLVESFNLKYAAITLGESFSSTQNGWWAMLYDGKEFYKSKKYDIHITDWSGIRDSLGGGLTYGLTTEMSNQEALEFAVAASCLKHTFEGDFNLVSAEEVLELIKGDTF